MFQPIDTSTLNFKKNMHITIVVEHM